jgi:quinol monooxygenase YgiN
MKIVAISMAIVATLSLAVISSSRAQQPAATPGGAVYVATFIDLTPPNAAAGTRAVQQYVVDSRKEPGNVRIEAVVQSNRQNHLVVFEVWRDQKALDTHEASAGTKDFRTKMQPLLGSPFDQRLHHLLPAGN